MRRNPVLRPIVVLVAAATLFGFGCSSSSSDDAGSSTTVTTEETTTAAPEEKPTVLVTNDDGVDSEGIDALVTALNGRGDIEVVVAAPFENQSGKGGQTTEGTLEVTDAELISGTPAHAVHGTPADSVKWALGEGGIKADLVISGVNDGQNIGPLVPLSGTVGAARQAAQLGVPALATSQGFGEPADFPSGVAAAMGWLDEHLQEVIDGKLGTDKVANLNTPTCPAGQAIQGEVDVPVATDSSVDLTDVNCEGTEDPTDDVTGFVNGWTTLSELEPTGSNTE